MRKSLYAFLIAGFFAAPAWACEPCMQTLTLDQTIQQADLILIGESAPYDMNLGPTGPAEIDVNVVKVLKGTYPERTIRVKSWYGMCPYGFVFRHPQEVMFISAKDEGNYTRVNSGCDTNQLSFEKGLVDGKEPLEEFVKNHIENPKPSIPTEKK